MGSQSTKTYRLSKETRDALQELADLTGLSYDELLRRASRLLHDSAAVKELIAARKKFLADHPEATDRRAKVRA